MNKAKLRARRRMQRWACKAIAWDELSKLPAPAASHYFNRDAKPITFWKWMKSYRSEEYKQLNVTMVGPYYVSTVWLGLDHGFLGSGPPIIFETMVFADYLEDGRAADFSLTRYETIQDALRGHDVMVKYVRESLQ